MHSKRIRKTYQLRGVVQGVGFRPALYRLAHTAGLAGSAQNCASFVRLVLEGPANAVDAFVSDLPAHLPGQARIESISEVECHAPSSGDVLADFVILESAEEGLVIPSIPADLAMCSACRAEVSEPSNRRHGYPFTTCTDCGPRYTIVDGMPYDRKRTTMRHFTLCDQCRREYDTPADRRFHAETNACPSCGPQLVLKDMDGSVRQGNALRIARKALADGRIVAVRGVGGFLLAANAFRPDTLRTLRQRKRRPFKPFAVMASDLETAAKYVEIPPAARVALSSAGAPIVILDVCRNAVPGALPLDLIAPDTQTLGIMLPTSPLHLLLLEGDGGDPTPRFEMLIMTSGNRGGEPICLADEEALERLGGIADFLLTHDRDIRLRNDDSIVAMQHAEIQVWRRARGYAPNAIVLAKSLSRRVLAMGAELKNTIALGFDDRVVLSPHVGDLETPEAVDSLEQVARCLPEFLNRSPDIVAVDLHPDMHSTLLGRRMAAERGLHVVEVQHHHAHAAACLAEHGLTEGLALVLDGTGLGTDGTIWGAELLDVRGAEYRRLATFAPVPLPGGDAAVREPVRQLVGRLVAAGIPVEDELIRRLGIQPEQASTWISQCRHGVHTPVTRAAGRLFDSFSVLLGVSAATATYEGQTAIRLEAAASRYHSGLVPEVCFTATERSGILEIDWADAFRMLAKENTFHGKEPAVALGIHEAVARACGMMIEFAVARSNSRVVSLSGGVFMNRILTDGILRIIEEKHLRGLLHRQVPPNDGGISLGQVVVAGSESEI